VSNRAVYAVIIRPQKLNQFLHFSFLNLIGYALNDSIHLFVLLLDFVTMLFLLFLYFLVYFSKSYSFDFGLLEM